MTREPEGADPMRGYFTQAVHRALNEQMGLSDAEDVEAYLGGMLAEFVHLDHVYEIRDATGNRVRSVAEMMLEGDVRFNADSFERERQVHRHIGDFLLFWCGIFPEFLRRLQAPGEKDSLLDPVRQGQQSYYVASTFDYDPYVAEAALFRKLSEGFEQYCLGLRLVRSSFVGLGGR